MIKSERDRIKEKIFSIAPEKWWGDEFDVRFYLISKLKSVKNSSVLDVGGGIGILSSELDDNNFKINADLSKEDLLICKNKFQRKIGVCCSILTNLPFRDKTFDIIIASSVLQYVRNDDVICGNVIKDKINQYPRVEKALSEIKRVLRPNGRLFLVTPNNAYYKSYMFNYMEIKKAVSNYFDDFSISFYNTYPRLSKKIKKLNFANVIPKIFAKLYNPDQIINSLNKAKSHNNYSVSFFVEAKKRKDD